MQGKQFKSLCRSAVLIAAAAFMLNGCSGSDGRDGVNGANGTNASSTVNVASLTADEISGLTLTGEVSSVTINSPPVVTFKITDAAGNPVAGLDEKNTAGTALQNLRFAIAKLVPGTNGSPDQWVSYMVTATSRPTTESNGTLVANSDGSYTYTFAKDITDSTLTGGVTYEPTRTHRLAIQVSGTIPSSGVALANPLNIVHDFVPAGGTPAKHEVVTIEACNECHDKLAFHGGGRLEAKYCVVCHTDQRKIGRSDVASAAGAFTGTQYVADGEVLGNMATMVHKIHMGNRLTKTGYDYAGVKFNEIGYPQDIMNCIKCHKASAAAPQADNWKNKPSRVACGSCHDGVNFANGAGHGIGGPRTDDSMCAACHPAAEIERYHLTENATPNNPNVATGLVNFTYDIKSVTVNGSNQPVVTFRILKDGVPVTFDGAGTNSLAGFTGGPSFLIAYAQTQSGITAPADYNNLGKAAGQPASVSVGTLFNATNGTLSAPDADGYYTATITAAAAAFPAGSTMRAVALQGYYTQAAGTNGIAANTARYAVSVYKAVTGDSARRQVVDSAKCAKCHEWFEGHGGNRVYEVQVCIMCHNPNLSSSGRGANPLNMSATEQAKLTAAGYDVNTPATWPEASNNMKEMIHGIHAGSMRAEAGSPYQFVRDRGASGVFFYDWSNVVYPGILKNCESCHIPGTQNKEITNALVTTDKTIDAVTGLFTKTLTNNTDKVITPFTGACVSCHAGSSAKAHMSLNGGSVGASDRNAAPAESCATCHSANRSVDAAAIHR